MLRTLAIPALLLPAILLAQPPKRAHHSLAYDPARQRVILTGGSTPVNGGESYTFFNDLWSFDGTRWTAHGESGTKLSGTALAFNTKTSRMMSYGAYIGRTSLGDLRVLEENVWRTIGTHPTLIAAEPGLVYDPARERLVTFGGSGGRGVTHGDTWVHDGTTWSKLEIANPPARLGHAMVFDARRGKVVVFGGMGAVAPDAPQGTRPPRLGDLWEFDGRTWTRIHAMGPSARFAGGATYDSKRGMVIIFGGLGDGNLGDTWGWDGTSWKQLATTGPSPRSMGYLAYDARRDRVVLFGGRGEWPNDLNDTWEWDGTAWREVVIAPG
jgi:hypothetical protein